MHCTVRIQDTTTHAVDCSSLVPCFVYTYDCNVIRLLSMLYGLLLLWSTYGYCTRMYASSFNTCPHGKFVSALTATLNDYAHSFNQNLYVCSNCIV